MKKSRLDVLMVAREVAPTLALAQALIIAGRVLVADAGGGEKKMDKPGTPVSEHAEIRVLGEVMPYVSRGGLKLAHALTTFAIDVRDKVGLDVGASTGGFTDCLLQSGAKKVYAVDVGYGQLADKLRQDTRVVNIERQNIRTMARAQIADTVDIIVIDASFISLKVVLPAALDHAQPNTNVIALVKPQFEVKKDEVQKGGVVRDPLAHAAVLAEMRALVETVGRRVKGLTPSPITGKKEGNTEFLLWLA
jgi:23S rRNA (cytidine1920-2'-O)/16S rRNA (cytidine1409-2'-O)-methyltransferase